MNVIKITLVEKLNSKLKKSIFNAIRQSGIYEISDESLGENNVAELDSFYFKSIAEDYQFKLQFVLDGRCLKISSDFLDSEEDSANFKNGIREILEDSQIRILVNKRITLDKLILVLEQFKNKNVVQSVWYKLGGGVVTTISLAVGFHGIKFLGIFVPFLIIGLGAIAGFLYLGWIFHGLMNIEKNVLTNPEKEAKRIFDELKDY